MSQGQNSRSAGHDLTATSYKGRSDSSRHFCVYVCVWGGNTTGTSKLGYIVYKEYSISTLDYTVNIAELKKVWSCTSAPPYVVISPYLIEHKQNY